MRRNAAIMAAHVVMWTKGTRRGREIHRAQAALDRPYRPRHADPALVMDAIEAAADA